MGKRPTQPLTHTCFWQVAAAGREAETPPRRFCYLLWPATQTDTTMPPKWLICRKPGNEQDTPPASFAWSLPSTKLLTAGAGPTFPGITFPEMFRDKHGDVGMIVWGPVSQSQKLHVVGVHQLPGCALLGASVPPLCKCGQTDSKWVGMA